MFSLSIPIILSQGLKEVERLKNQNKLVESLEQAKSAIDFPTLSHLFKNQTDLFELKPDIMYFPRL